MAIRVLRASSIADAFATAVDFIGGWAADPTPNVWFRGVTSRDFSLQPGACRRPGFSELEPLLTFTQEGVAFADIGSLDSWSSYYLAQHYRLPTRLLDWTVSFSAALFFAFDGWNGAGTPCIWLLQPFLFNEAFISWRGIISPENNRELEVWLPRVVAEPHRRVIQDSQGFVYNNENPIAIYPRKTNGRMNAQQGTFTLHGRSTDDLQVLIRRTGQAVENVLARIDLTKFKPNRVFQELATLGVRRSTVYPDLDNFVLEIKSHYNW